MVLNVLYNEFIKNKSFAQSPQWIGEAETKQNK